MNFDVAGPFKLTRHGTKKLITDQSLTDLKAQLGKVGILAFAATYAFPSASISASSISLCWSFMGNYPR